MLLSFNEVSKSYGTFDVLKNISFQLNAGDKLGLIGSNGSGKTTILQLIERPDEVDSGTVTRVSGLRLGRLDQHTEFYSDTVLNQALDSYKHVQDMEHSLRHLEGLMHAAAPDAALLDRYADLQHEFEAQGGYTYHARTESAVFGLGFRKDQLEQAPNSLSGGERNRLALACLLLKDTDCILLDEPTNHLDIRAIEWLEGFLTRTDRTLLIVSHDRLFLDRVVNGVLELNNGTLRRYKGNYTAYLEQRDEARKREEREWKKQQRWIEDTEEYIRRNIAGQKTRQAQSRRKALLRTPRVERPSVASPSVRFRFSPAQSSGRQVIRTTDLSIGHTPSNRLAGPLSVDIDRGQRWAILGPNGAGKTTLLATLSGKRTPLGGTVERLESRIGYYDQGLEELTPTSTVFETLRSLDVHANDGKLRNFLAGFLFRGEEVYKEVRDLSGGEQSRLALARLVYQAPPLLALDEPTNHLDIASREALELALQAYDGTLLIVTHDRRLVERLATHILYLSVGSVRVFHSFDRFEEWLSTDTVPSPTPGARSVRPTSVPKTSKRKQDQLRVDIESLEAKIVEAEHELSSIEVLFQEAAADLEWASAHRRYSELQSLIDESYEKLERKLAEADQ